MAEMVVTETLVVLETTAAMEMAVVEGAMAASG